MVSFGAVSSAVSFAPLFSQIDVDGTTIQLDRPSLYSFLGIRGILKCHEAEASGSTGIAISNDLGFTNRTEFRHSYLQAMIFSVPGEPTTKDFVAHLASVLVDLPTRIHILLYTRSCFSRKGHRENTTWRPVGISSEMADEKTTEAPSRIPPLRHQPIVFLDVETTGLDPKVHEIVEIAIVALEGTILLDTKVKPVNLASADQRALKINGYLDHPELWDGAPTFDEIKDDVMEALKHKVVVGQNPNFDRNFVVEALARCGVASPQKRVKRHVVDVITLAWEHLVPCGLNKLNLAAECEFMGIPLNRDERHGALPDAQAVRTLYLMMLRATEEQRFAWRERAKKLGLLPEEPEKSA